MAAGVVAEEKPGDSAMIAFAEAFCAAFVRIFVRDTALSTTLSLLVWQLSHQSAGSHHRDAVLVLLHQMLTHSDGSPMRAEQWTRIFNHVLKVLYSADVESADLEAVAAQQLRLLLARMPADVPPTVYAIGRRTWQEGADGATDSALFVDGALGSDDAALVGLYARLLRLDGNVLQEAPTRPVVTAPAPIIMELQPTSGPPGTVLTLRGVHLGTSAADVQSLSVCGIDCLDSLQFISQLELRCMVPSAPTGAGPVALVTVSGGPAKVPDDVEFDVTAAQRSFSSARVKRKPSGLAILAGRPAAAGDGVAAVQKRNLSPYQRGMQSRRLQDARDREQEQVQRVFGVALETVCDQERRSVPLVVELCVDEVEARGLDEEGIYRLSGRVHDVEAIRLEFDRRRVARPNLSRWDIHAVAGALKLYMRELPDPLIPHDLYAGAVSAGRIEAPDERLQECKRIVQALSEPRRNLLHTLARHLLRIVAAQERNRMNMRNICLVWGMVLLRPQGSLAVQNLPAQSAFLEAILTHYVVSIEPILGSAGSAAAPS